MGTATDSISYTYGNSDWGDLLNAYDGQAITYDTIGNPLTDGTWTYTWQHGRQLASMTDGTYTWYYTYNADGLRTNRNHGATSYDYIYNGDKLTQMDVKTLFGSYDGTSIYNLSFTYDANGIPLTVTCDTNTTDITPGTYYYVTNIQGDVVGILDGSGNQVVGYTYDAWGNILETSGTMASTLGFYNPLRYRSYVYDQETSLYYLQSRYYNPETGRFINGDGLVATGQGLLGNNMFAYCTNNPVVFMDSSGMCIEVGALLTWYDCGNHLCPTSSLSQPSRYSGGFNNPQNNYHLDSTSYWEGLTETQETVDISPITFYNGVPVITVPGSSSFSFGIIFMGKEGSENLLRHEYGHTIQLQELGIFDYYKYVVKPSVYRYWKTVEGVYSWDSYYSTPWEYQADQYGGAVHNYLSWASDTSERYWERVHNLT